MKVSLISYTTPSTELLERFRQELDDPYVKLDDLQDLIVFCARVSNPSNQTNVETGEKLLKYLIKNKHWSPFEMVDVTLEIEIQRDISRQHLRHRFSFQEFSQRYAEALGFEFREARMQDPKNRQKSIPYPEDSPIPDEWEWRQKRLLDLVKEDYKWALENNMAKECARVILPEGLTMSRLYAKNSIRGWIHYLQVRAVEKGGAQKEHILMAQECARVIATVFPHINDFITNEG